MNNYHFILKISFFLTLCFVSILSSATEPTKPNFSKMKVVDHANRILTDEKKYYLVIYRNFYKKELKAYVEVPKLLPGYSYVSQQCTLDDKYNAKITAIVKIDLNLEKWKDVRNAWLVDISSSSIATLEPSRVYCFNDAWEL